jgi:hypothetical protein
VTARGPGPGAPARGRDRPDGPAVSRRGPGAPRRAAPWPGAPGGRPARARPRARPACAGPGVALVVLASSALAAGCAGERSARAGILAGAASASGSHAFQLSASVDLGLRHSDRGYWEPYAAAAPEAPPSAREVRNAKRLLRTADHVNQLYLISHRQYEPDVARAEFVKWRDAPVAPGDVLRLVPTLVLQDYCTHQCNFTHAELAERVPWRRAHVNRARPTPAHPVRGAQGRPAVHRRLLPAARRDRRHLRARCAPACGGSARVGGPSPAGHRLLAGVAGAGAAERPHACLANRPTGPAAPPRAAPGEPSSSCLTLQEREQPIAEDATQGMALALLVRPVVGGRGAQWALSPPRGRRARGGLTVDTPPPCWLS